MLRRSCHRLRRSTMDTATRAFFRPGLCRPERLVPQEQRPSATTIGPRRGAPSHRRYNTTRVGSNPPGPARHHQGVQHQSRRQFTSKRFCSQRSSSGAHSRRRHMVQRHSPDQPKGHQDSRADTYLDQPRIHTRRLQQPRRSPRRHRLRPLAFQQTWRRGVGLTAVHHVPISNKETGAVTNQEE